MSKINGKRKINNEFQSYKKIRDQDQDQDQDKDQNLRPSTTTVTAIKRKVPWKEETKTTTRIKSVPVAYKRKNNQDYHLCKKKKSKAIRYLDQYIHCFEIIIQMNYLHFNELYVTLLCLTKDIKNLISIDRMYRPTSIQSFHPCTYPLLRCHNGSAADTTLERMLRLAHYNKSIFARLQYINFSSFHPLALEKLNLTYTFSQHIKKVEILHWQNQNNLTSKKLLSLFTNIETLHIFWPSEVHQYDLIFELCSFKQYKHIQFTCSYGLKIGTILYLFLIYVFKNQPLFQFLQTIQINYTDPLSSSSKEYRDNMKWIHEKIELVSKKLPQLQSILLDNQEIYRYHVKSNV